MRWFRAWYRRKHRCAADREAAFLAQTLHRVGCYPMNYSHTPDGIREWAQDLVESGATEP